MDQPLDTVDVICEKVDDLSTVKILVGRLGYSESLLVDELAAAANLLLSNL